MNRRHYDFIGYLRSQLSDRFCVRFVQVNISEQSKVYDLSDATESNRVQNLWLSSSIHELDLLLYLFGDLALKHIYRRRDKSSGWLTSINAVLESTAGFPVFLTSNWNSSESKSILIETEDRTFRLGPIEVLSVSEGLARIEPTPETPTATYVPNEVHRVETDRTHKPGFLNQASDFLEAARTKALGRVSRVSVEDALRVTRLTELLLDDSDHRRCVRPRI
jgi:predicted dehydrogenase